MVICAPGATDHHLRRLTCKCGTWVTGQPQPVHTPADDLEVTRIPSSGDRENYPPCPEGLWALQSSVTSGSGYRESEGYNKYTAEVTHRVTASPFQRALWKSLHLTLCPLETLSQEDTAAPMEHEGVGRISMKKSKPRFSPFPLDAFLVNHSS